MRQRDLAAKITKRLDRKGLGRSDVEAVLRALSGVVSDELLEGEEVRIQGVGSLFVAFKFGKFRLRCRPTPSFVKKLGTDFVENRKADV